MADETAPSREAPPPPAETSTQTPRAATRMPRVPGVVVAALAGAIIALVLGLAFGSPAPSAGHGNADPGAPEDAGNADGTAPEALIAGDAATGLVDAEATPPQPPRFRVAQLKGDASVDVVELTLGKRTLSAALGEAHLSIREQTRLLHAFEGKKRFDRLSPKDQVTFAKEKKSGKLIGFEYATSPFDVWQARERDDGDLVAAKLEFVVSEVRVLSSFRVETDLHAAAEKAALHADIAKELDEALDGHVELASIKPGSRFRVVATEARIDGEFSHYARIDALEYVNARGDEALRVYHHARHQDHPHSTTGSGGATNGSGGYYDRRGQRPYHGAFRSPIPAARITSRFNPRRMHPVLHVVMPHNGIDFSAQPGTSVYASSAGTVRSVGDSGPCGNMVQIAHEGGIVTAYCHLSRFASGVHPGVHVETRQLIGYSGATGRVSGPHLHFAAKRGEAFIDPQGLKLDGVRTIPAADRDAFQKARGELDGVLDGIPTTPGTPNSMPAPASATPGAGDGGVESEDEVLDLPEPGAPTHK